MLPQRFRVYQPIWEYTGSTYIYFDIEKLSDFDVGYNLIVFFSDCYYIENL